MDYNATVELDSRDFDESAIDLLMDLIEPYHGAVGRSLTGRVELILTLPADNLRQAAATAVAIAQSAGHTPFSIEAMPTAEFDRRIEALEIPPLLSVPEAAEALGVSRQRVLQLVNGGQLDAVKIGDTWAILRASVTARDEQHGLRFSGLFLPVDVVSGTGQLVAEQAVDIVRQPLPVFDEADNVIGLGRSIRREAEGWTVVGVLRGLRPGTYAVAARVDSLGPREVGTVAHPEALRVTGLTVLTTREASLPQVQIEVLPGRRHLDLRQLQPEPSEVLSYP